MAKVNNAPTEEKKVGASKKEKNIASPQKLTYEQLEQLVSQYYNQSKALSNALEETKKHLNSAIEELNAVRANEYWMRLDWLWRVITLEDGEEIFSSEFVEKAAKEFMLRINPENPPIQTTKKENS